MAVMMRSMLEVADNSGASKLQVILPLGGGTGLTAHLGDVFTASVKEASPDGTAKTGTVVKVVKKHIKSQGQRTKGGIADQESRIAISNVMVICPSCQQPTRIGHDHKGERSIRICKRCDSPLDK